MGSWRRWRIVLVLVTCVVLAWAMTTSWSSPVYVNARGQPCNPKRRKGCKLKGLKTTVVSEILSLTKLMVKSGGFQGLMTAVVIFITVVYTNRRRIAWLVNVLGLHQVLEPLLSWAQSNDEIPTIEKLDSMFSELPKLIPIDENDDNKPEVYETKMSDTNKYVEEKPKSSAQHERMKSELDSIANLKVPNTIMQDDSASPEADGESVCAKVDSDCVRKLSDELNEGSCSNSTDPEAELPPNWLVFDAHLGLVEKKVRDEAVVARVSSVINEC